MIIFKVLYSLVILIGIPLTICLVAYNSANVILGFDSWIKKLSEKAKNKRIVKRRKL